MAQVHVLSLRASLRVTMVTRGELDFRLVRELLADR